MSKAEEWRRHIAELRQVVAQTSDSERRRNLDALAERWEAFAKELEKAEGLIAA